MRTAETNVRAAIDHLQSVQDELQIIHGITSVVMHMHDLLCGQENWSDRARHAYDIWAQTIPLDGTIEQFHAARDEIIHTTNATLSRVHEWATQPRAHEVLPDVRQWADDHLGRAHPQHGNEIMGDGYAHALMDSTADSISHAHQHLRPAIAESLTHLHQQVTELRAATDPGAIRQHVLGLLNSLNHALYGHTWHHGLGEEYAAWESFNPHALTPAAVEPLAHATEELHTMVHGWVANRSMPGDWVATRDDAVGHVVYIASTVR